MAIIPGQDWEELVDSIEENKGIVFLLGATDSGKSTLARYLTENFVLKKSSVAFVDSDVGQTSLGLPGTISAKLFSDKDDLEHFTFKKMFFIGDINPAKKIHLMISGTKRMVDAYKGKADIIIVDSTGLIAGEIGISLKTGKIKAIKPEHIIALQKQDELEHILGLIKDYRIHRIKISPMVKARKREERVAYRKKRFEEYFGRSGMNEFSLSDVEFFYNGRSFSLRHTDFTRGTIIGLDHNEDTLALGILVEIVDNSITFRSPVKSLRAINRVVFGDVAI